MRLIFILIFIFSTNNIWAIDDSVLSANYPGFNDYTASSLVDLKNYFRNLYQKSDQYISEDGHRHLIVQNKMATEIAIIDLLIERKLSSNQIIEEVHYSLSNGNRFDLTFFREGAELLPTPDHDLLTLKFSPTPNLTRYVITLVQLDTEYELRRDTNKEEGFLKLGLLDVNILLETLTSETEVTRNFIFFTRMQPDPQSQISVTAITPSGGWGEANYLHFSPNTGEISPKMFFDGLNGINMMFKQMSNIFVMKLYGLGFPVI